MVHSSKEQAVPIGMKEWRIRKDGSGTRVGLRRGGGGLEEERGGRGEEEMERTERKQEEKREERVERWEKRNEDGRRPSRSKIFVL